ncbi:mucin-2-like isoform X2 [Gouania willdenowi]|uniref:mucin-2-like isoform X2 n=1 Tax=Gouania willdenowi TaxID=441366 RepID=UPI0010552820|nr:mucin-2-like isoform X2 [Gouania willdenowi]
MNWRRVWLSLLFLSVTEFFDIQAKPVENHVSSICSTWGRERFKTFDGDMYQFPGACEYNLVSDCNAVFQEFSVHIKRSNNNGNPTFSYVVVTINTLAFHLNKSQVTVNDKPVSTPFLNGGVQVENNADYLKLQAKVGITVVWNGEDAIMVEVDYDYMNRTCGLCGNFDGVPGNDFIYNGHKFNPIEFGNKQKVHRPNDKCEDLYEGDDESTQPFRVSDSCKKFKIICDQLLLESWSSCTSLINPELYIQACVQDMCSCKNTPNDFCLCSTLSEFSRQCSHAGGDPPSWRNTEFCAKQCPHNMVYSENGSPCMNTCTNQDSTWLCEDHNMDGCFCPSGTVFDDISERGCIPQSECQCKHNKIYESGEVYKQDREECTCREGIWECKSLETPETCAFEDGSHVTTFDGKTLAFHGNCFYTLVKVESMAGTNPGFTILAQLIPCADQELDTCLKTVKLLMDNNKNNFIMFTSDGTVKQNSQIINLPYHTGEISIFMLSSFHILLQTSFGLQIQIQHVPIMQVFIRLDPSYFGKTRGLCGNYNKIMSDDTKTRQGIVEGTATTFIDSWKADDLCSDCQSRLEDPCSFSVENDQYSKYWCAVLLSKNSTFTPCYSVVDPDVYYKRCIYSSCNCEKSEECLCGVFSSYAQACASKGVLLSEWKENVCDKYMKSCPASQVFSFNHQRCQLTCRSLALKKQSCLSDFPPVDGCNCAEGSYLDDNQICVPVSKCPCYNDNVYIKPGKSVNIKNEHCVCSNGVLNCQPLTPKPSTCVAPKVFFNCSSAVADELEQQCTRTCSYPDKDDCDSSECESGCVCPDGLLDDGKGSCVKKNECPCNHNGRLYAHRSQILNQCNKCACKSGKWACTEKQCPATCIIYGSGHYTTFDQKTYTFQGNCAYTAVKNKCSNKTQAVNFGVVTENVPCGSTRTTCSKSVRVYLGRNEIKLFKGKYQEQDLGSGAEIEYKIRRVGLYLLIESTIGLAIVWDRRTTVRILLEPKHMGEVCGLCGNYDGDGQNDFTTQNHLVVSSPLEFGNTWKMSSSCPDTESSDNACEASPNRHQWSKMMCSIITGNTFTDCHKTVDPSPFYENCVKDSCACDSGGDCECFCAAVATYAQACSEAGVCVSWRTPEICPVFCDYYNHPDACEWHYNPCHTPCFKTCLNPKGICINPIPNLEGCFPVCPDDKPFLDERSHTCVKLCAATTTISTPTIISTIPSTTTTEQPIPTSFSTLPTVFTTTTASPTTLSTTQTLTTATVTLRTTIETLPTITISTTPQTEATTATTVSIATPGLTTPTETPNTIFTTTATESTSSTETPTPISATTPTESTAIAESTTLATTTPVEFTAATETPTISTTIPIVTTTIAESTTTLFTNTPVETQTAISTTTSTESTTILFATSPVELTTTTEIPTPISATTPTESTTILFATSPVELTTTTEIPTPISTTTPTESTTIAESTTLATTTPVEFTAVTETPTISTTIPIVTTTIAESTTTLFTNTPVETQTAISTTTSTESTTILFATSPVELTTTTETPTPISTTTPTESTIIAESTTLATTTPVEFTAATETPTISTTIPIVTTTITESTTTLFTNTAVETPTAISTSTPNESTTITETALFTTTPVERTTTIETPSTTTPTESTIIAESTTLATTTPVEFTAATETPTISTTIPTEITTITESTTTFFTNTPVETQTAISATTPTESTIIAESTTPVEFTVATETITTATSPTTPTEATTTVFATSPVESTATTETPTPISTTVHTEYTTFSESTALATTTPGKLTTTTETPITISTIVLTESTTTTTILLPPITTETSTNIPTESTTSLATTISLSTAELTTETQTATTTTEVPTTTTPAESTTPTETQNTLSTTTQFEFTTTTTPTTVSATTINVSPTTSETPTTIFTNTPTELTTPSTATISISTSELTTTITETQATAETALTQSTTTVETEATAELVQSTSTTETPTTITTSFRQSPVTEVASTLSTATLTESTTTISTTVTTNTTEEPSQVTTQTLSTTPTETSRSTTPTKSASTTEYPTTVTRTTPAESTSTAETSALTETPSVSVTPTLPLNNCPAWGVVQNESFNFCNCTVATCIGNNTLEILPYECPPMTEITCSNGIKPALVWDEFHCCQQYVCDCVCESWGGSHYNTFDGSHYTFHGKCTYVLMEEISPTFNLKIYIEGASCDDIVEVGSCSRSIIVMYGSLVVRLKTTKVDGASKLEALANSDTLRLPFVQQGVVIINSGLNLILEIPRLELFIRFGRSCFTVFLPFQYFGRNTQGLCGTCTNNQADDCMLPGGQLVNSCAVMAEFWPVTGSGKTKCRKPLALPVNPPEPMPKPSPCRDDSECDLLISRGPFAECHDLVDPSNFHSSCVSDSCNKVDPVVECESLESYASACAQAGVCVDWRQYTKLCVLDCPSNKVYKPCSSAEQPTCEDNSIVLTASIVTEGCFCPEGMTRFNVDSEFCVKMCGCLDPENNPREFNEQFEYRCQDCICEISKVVTCRPKVCPEPETVRCVDPGYVLVNQTNPSDPCCLEQVCQCQITTCPVPKVSCSVGFRPILSVPAGKCCPEHTCVPKRVCVHQDVEYEPGSSVPGNECEDCSCTTKVDPSSGGLLKILCTVRPCIQSCALGFEYVRESSDTCCGRCVQTHCVITESGSKHFLIEGETWSPSRNRCEVYVCARIGDILSTLRTTIPCPELDESKCLPNTIQTAANGCCKICEEKEKGCKLMSMKSRLLHKGCQSLQEVEMPFCEGSCNTFTKYSQTNASIQHFCSCCKETRSSKRKVKLHCLNGKTFFHSYVHVDECGCDQTDCDKTSVSSTRKRRSLSLI